MLSNVLGLRSAQAEAFLFLKMLSVMQAYVPSNKRIKFSLSTKLGFDVLNQDEEAAQIWYECRLSGDFSAIKASRQSLFKLRNEEG